MMFNTSLVRIVAIQYEVHFELIRHLNSQKCDRGIKDIRVQGLEGAVFIWVSRGGLYACWKNNINSGKADVIEYGQISTSTAILESCPFQIVLNLVGNTIVGVVVKDKPC